MDLGKYDLEADAARGADCILYDPVSGKNTNAVVTLLGRDAPDYRKARRELISRLRDYPADKQPTDEDRRIEAARALAATTLGWKNIELDGKSLPFSQENAVRLYADPRCGWVVNQLEEFCTTRSNFSKG